MFKTLRGSNPSYLQPMYVLKETQYDFRNEKLVIQPKKNKTTYGIRSLSYVGAKLWNDMKFEFDNFDEMEIHDFKRLLNNWNGPDLNAFKNYV